MHSSKEQQPKQDTNDSLFGMALGQVFMASVLGPVADMVWEAAETASAVYTDRFEARAQKADNRTNGHEGGFHLGVKHSLGGSFNRAQTITTHNQNILDLSLPYWKRDYMPAPRFAA